MWEEFMNFFHYKIDREISPKWAASPLYYDFFVMKTLVRHRETLTSIMNKTLNINVNKSLNISLTLALFPLPFFPFRLGMGRRL